MNPHDLTGRDLDLAVTKRLGYVWWEGKGGVSYQQDHERPPEGWHRIDAPGPEWGSPWLPGYDCDGGRIPEMFAEIAKEVPDGCEVVLRRKADGTYEAVIPGSVSYQWMIEEAAGSTPTEALARLLLMVTQR